MTIMPEIWANLLLMLGLLLLVGTGKPGSQSVRILIASLFLIVNSRYLYWRFFNTLPDFAITFEMVWMWGFFLVEFVAAFIFSIHLLIMATPRSRSADADLAELRLRQRESQPGVDILIPTYNESEELLERTIRAAVRVDYPDFEVWVLDDGNRPWLEALCHRLGTHYVARSNRRGYKAGNLNHGVGLSQKPMICVVDADFAVDPQILWRTVGFFEDPEVGLVQTPQRFVNPDAIQFNLGGEEAWVEQQGMFSQVMQPGRDLYGNAFCYGTGFVVRRSALESIGGFREETVTEDIHTSYCLVAAGYRVCFLNESLALGIATQDLAAYVKQRCRWCIGSIQCLFVKGGALRSRGLSFLDRLFYLDPILYHVGTLWTFLLVLAPAVYWWTGIPPFVTDFGHLLLVLAPRVLLGAFGIYWLSDKRAIPFVAELGRVVCIFHLTAAILRTLIQPFRQEFAITLKSGSGEHRVIYWRIMGPLAGLLFLTVLGLAFRTTGLFGVVPVIEPNFGLMIALTIYVLWLLYFSCLLCVQRPFPNGPLDTVPVRESGGLFRSLTVLARRLTYPR